MTVHRSPRQLSVILMVVIVAALWLVPRPVEAAGPAVTFSLGGSVNTIGVPFSATVNALDSNGALATDYRGTVHFTSTDPLAILPADYTFTATDNGRHTFQGLRFGTGGTQAITMTDTVDPAITGSRTFTNLIVPGATHFDVGAPASTTVGQPVAVVVRAVGPGGAADSNYRGTVTFTSSTDPGAVLPDNYTFTEEDRGVHRFCPASDGGNCTGGVAFSTVNPAHTVTVTDTTAATITGTSNPVNVTADLPTRFSVTGSTVAVVGGEALVSVSAVNAQSATISSYRGTVGLSSTDPLAEMPPDYTFTEADRGRHNFFIRMGTVGTFTVTVYDRADESLTGTSQPIVVRQGQVTTTTSTSTTTTAPGLSSEAVAPNPTVAPPAVAPVTPGASGASGVAVPVASTLPGASLSGVGTGSTTVPGTRAATSSPTTRVSAAAVPTTVAPRGGIASGSLARTGTSAPGAFAVGGLAIAVGFWAVVASRTTRRQRSWLR